MQQSFKAMASSYQHQAGARRRKSKSHQPPRRLDSTTDRLLQSIFMRTVALSDVELEYLTAAETGDVAAVQRAVVDYSVNINCVDNMGRCALELALIGNNRTVVEYLLPRSNLQSIEDGLLHAISKDDVRMCELFLDHPLYKNQRMQLSSSDGFYNKDNDSPRLRYNTTPIVLAAQRNNFYIVQLLLIRGSKITPPHDYFCDCMECVNMRVFDSVKYSQSRLNTFMALASPSYISLNSDDPILTAFQLSHQLETLAEIEKEYKFEYKRLSKQCKDYAVELLDLCRSTEEIVCLLNEDEREDKSHEPHDISPCDPSTNSLARVKLALKYEQKRFIAQATCQRQLISLWYSGMPWLRHQHVSVKLLAVPIATLLLPLLALAFLIAPKSKLGVIMRSPFVKFLNHTCAYIVFLVLLFIATTRGGSGNPFLDMACEGISKTMPDSIVYILIFIWVLGMLLHECRQLWREGPKDYICDWWNWMDSSLIFLYLAYYAMQFVVYAKVVNATDDQKDYLCPDVSLMETCRSMKCEVERGLHNWTTCSGEAECREIDYLWTPKSKGDIVDTLSEMLQLADIFFALANVLSFARIAHLLPANEQLGPLLVSFGRMLHDVVRFGVVFSLVFVAFMCGLTSLYRVHQCENTHFSRLDLTLSSLFWATFGMGDTKATVIDNRYLGSDKNLITTHSSHHPLTVIVGYGLFWSYITGAVVVLLNMLIAMMSNSFQEIYDDRDVEWKFARAKLWIDFFEDGCTLPTPVNLIPNPKYVVHFFKYIRKKIRRTRDDPPVQMAYIYTRRKNGMVGEDISKVDLPPKPESLYQHIIRRLVQRYIYLKQCEFAQKQVADNEIFELKQEVSSLNNDVMKLRHEIAYVSNSVKENIRPKNGYRPPTSPSRISRVELEV